MGMGVAGMIITNDCGSFPHSLLSTSKLLIFIEGSIWSGLLWDASKSSKYARSQFGVQVSCTTSVFREPKNLSWKGAAGWTHQINLWIPSSKLLFSGISISFNFHLLILLHHWFIPFNCDSITIHQTFLPNPPRPRECFAGHASLPPQLCSHAHPPPSSDRPYARTTSHFGLSIHGLLRNPKMALVVYLPSWKIWKSVGMMIPYIWKNKTCFKPPTRASIAPTHGFPDWMLQSSSCNCLFFRAFHRAPVDQKDDPIARA